MNSITAAPKCSGDAQEIEPDTCFETFGEKGYVENRESRAQDDGHSAGGGGASDNMIELRIGDYDDGDNATIQATMRPQSTRTYYNYKHHVVERAGVHRRRKPETARFRFQSSVREL